MQIRKAYKFRLKTTPDQDHYLELIAGHCRFLWNKVLRLNLERLANRQPIIWYHEADFWSKIWKSSQEYGFLKEVPAHCLQQKLKDLDKSFKDAFDKKQPLKRMPTWRKKGQRIVFVSLSLSIFN
jgi:putative transposase